MPLYLGGMPLSPSAIYAGPMSASELYLGSTLLWQSGGGGGPPPTLRTLASVGDSTSAVYPTGIGIVPVCNYIAGVNPTLLAVPGHTIAQQRAIWGAQSYLTKQSYDCVTMGGPGLNDITESGDATGAVSRLQALVNDIRSGVRSDTKIVIAQMTPCSQRWYDIYGPTGGPIAYQQWLDLNAAIAGTGPTPITGVDARVTAHVAQMASTLNIIGSKQGAYSVTAQQNCLNPAYETINDHIHENNYARQNFMAVGLRAALVGLGVLT